MKSVFVDTDILLDYLLERKPFYNDALKLMNAGATGK
jgi:predicted nucleic acid-binding protein